jgi:tetratricopeptide (TPR) repeat protein
MRLGKILFLGSIAVLSVLVVRSVWQRPEVKNFFDPQLVMDPLDLPANPTAGEEWDSAIAPAQAGNPGLSVRRLSQGAAAHPMDAAWPQAQAVCWARLGRFDSALSSLERCLAIAPLSPQATMLRRNSRIQHGLELATTGEPWKGRQLGEAVLQEFPDDSDAQFLVGYSRAMEGAIPLAEEILNEYTQRHPGSIPARAILAQCALRRGDAVRARIQVDLLEGLDPGSVQTTALLGQLVSLETRKPGASNRDLRVLCIETCPPSLESEVLDEAERAWNMLRLATGSSPTLPVSILIGTHSAAPHWAAATFDGQVHLPLEAAQNPALRTTILRHELTHAFLSSASGGRVPLWVNEGLAQYFQGERIKTLPGSATSGWLDSLPLRRSFLDLQEDQAELAYKYSLAVAQELMELHNSTALEAYLQRLREGQEEPEAFRKSFGDDYAQLSERIRRRL